MRAIDRKSVYEIMPNMTEKTISDLASEWGLQSIETARRRARRMGLPTRRDPIDRRRLLVAVDACQSVDKKGDENAS